MNKANHKVWLRVDLPELTYWPYWKLWPWDIMWGKVDIGEEGAWCVGLSVDQTVCFERRHIIYDESHFPFAQVKFKHLYLNR